MASEYESLPDGEKEATFRKFSRIKGGFRTVWYRPTLIDTVRICSVGGVNYLPLDVLVKIDEHDHRNKKRYIESRKGMNESAMDHSFVKDMYRLQRTKHHFADSRWFLLSHDYKTDTDLGWLYCVVSLYKEGGRGTNYIFSSGVLFGYDESNRNLQTVYYIEPCEVVYMLSKGDVLEGNKKDVSMRLLNRCL